MARIAVVEDDVAIREILAAILMDEAHIVTVCEPIEAARCVPEAVPDVVLLDLYLEKTTGEAVYGALRADPRTARVPIVIISATHDAGRTAQRLGASALLIKPFSLVQLDAVLDEVLHNPLSRLSLGTQEEGKE